MKTDKIVVPRPLPYFWPAALILALAACMLALFATSGHGPGVSPDSVYYLEGAENLRAGRGYVVRATQGQFEPIKHWPPGYSVLLAAAHVGGELVETARRINALLFGLNVMLMAWLVRRYSGSALAGLAAGLLVVAGQPMLEVHTTAWSEPLFFALSLGACVAFTKFREGGGWTPLLLAALLTGLALLVRLAAASFLAAMLVALVATLGGSRGTLFKRRLKAGAFTLVAVIPLGAWLISMGSRGGKSSRSFEFLGMPTVQDIADAGSSLSRWLLPQEVPLAVRGIVLGIVTLGLLALCGVAARNLWRRWRGRRAPSDSDTAQQFTVVFGVGYVGMLLGSMMVLDPEVVLDSRTLSPLYLCVAAGVPLACAQVLDAGRRTAGLALAAVTLACFAGGMAQTYSVASVLKQDGGGVNTIFWRQSQILAELRKLPDRTLVFTNQIAAARYWTKCDVLPLPPTLTTNRNDGNPPKVHPEYFVRTRKVLETLSTRGGAVATFENAEWYYQLPHDQQMRLLAEQLTPDQREYLSRNSGGQNLVSRHGEGELWVFAPASIR